MYSVNLFAPSGPGGVARPVSLPDIPQNAERRVDHIEKRIDAGKLDVETLDKRLQAHFGEAAKGIVGDDGSVDFDRLEKLIIETRSAKLQDRISARFGEDADGIVGPDGSIDKARLRELFAEQRLDSIIDRLKEKFGDRIDKVIGEDGKIDFAALKELIAKWREAHPPEPPLPEPPETKPPFVPQPRPLPELGRPLERAQLSVDDIKPDDGIRPRPVDPPLGEAKERIADIDPASRPERPALRPSDELAELRRTLSEARLERQFSDDGARFPGRDGKFDFDSLRQFFDENGPGHPHGRIGPKHPLFPGQPIQQRPFFDLRA